MSKKGKIKKAHHVTYNKKMFLAPDSINSMAAIHCKIKEDGIAMIRISDCNNSIRIWNDFNSEKEKKEMLLKIEILQKHLLDFRQEIETRINFNIS
jgi:hypothetical protein